MNVMIHKQDQEMYMTPNTIPMRHFKELPMGIQYHIAMILLEKFTALLFVTQPIPSIISVTTL